MAVSVGDIIRVAARCEWNNTDDVVNTFHFEIFTVPTGGSEAAFMEDLSDHIAISYAFIEGNQNTGLVAADITAFNVTQDAPLGITSWSAFYTGGTSAGEALPAFNAALILWRTNVKNRQGRTFIGGLNETQQNGGFLVSGAVSALNNFTATIRESTDLANGTDIRLVVYSRTTGERSIPTLASVRPIVAIMSRRKPGRGS